MSEVRSEPAPRRDARARSSHLGGRLRRVLVAPRSGFASALRAGVAERASDSRLPAFLVLLGGAATGIVYLKLTGLLQLRALDADDFRWSFFFTFLLLAALAGIGGYLLWAQLGPRLARRFAADVSGPKSRLVWAFADFPLAVYVALILPLDLAIVGPEIFATARLEGNLPMVWAALSVALALSATAWSAFLLWRGVETAGGLRARATMMMVVLAVGCYVASAALLVGVIALLGMFFG